MVNASCHDNQATSPPTHLCPELVGDFRTFPMSSSSYGGLLGSDGESDPFDNSSPPVDLDNGK